MPPMCCQCEPSEGLRALRARLLLLPNLATECSEALLLPLVVFDVFSHVSPSGDQDAPTVRSLRPLPMLQHGVSGQAQSHPLLFTRPPKLLQQSQRGEQRWGKRCESELLCRTRSCSKEHHLTRRCLQRSAKSLFNRNPICSRGDCQPFTPPLHSSAPHGWAGCKAHVCLLSWSLRIWWVWRGLHNSRWPLPGGRWI